MKKKTHPKVRVTRIYPATGKREFIYMMDERDDTLTIEQPFSFEFHLAGENVSIDRLLQFKLEWVDE